MTTGIIAGTAIYDIPSIEMEEVVVNTPYGDAVVFRGLDDNRDLVFLPRHGRSHTVPPHKVNYRANIKALEILGVTHLLATYAVGSINPNIPPLGLVAIDNFLDFTSGREATFYDGGVNKVKHVDMSMPFCQELRATLLKRSSEFELEIASRGTYVCTNGPRLETPAEIRMFAKLGGDVVGMTAVPEVVLAKELNICFAAVAFSVNWAAGIEREVRFIEEGLPELKRKLLALFVQTLRSATGEEVKTKKI